MNVSPISLRQRPTKSRPRLLRRKCLKRLAGLLALDRIRAAARPADAFHPLLVNARSTPNGLSLADLAGLAGALKMKYRMAYREAGAPGIVAPMGTGMVTGAGNMVGAMLGTMTALQAGDALWGAYLTGWLIGEPLTLAAAAPVAVSGLVTTAVTAVVVGVSFEAVVLYAAVVSTSNEYIPYSGLTPHDWIQLTH